MFLSPAHSFGVRVFSIIVDCIKSVRPPLRKRGADLELEEHPAEVAQGMVLSTAEVLVAAESVDVVQSLLEAALAQNVIYC